MAEVSAGLLVVRLTSGTPHFLLGHPGGPYFARKDEGVWTIPKGGIQAGETPLEAALREFAEELGFPPPPGDRVPLGKVRQRSGKLVHAWAVLGDVDPREIASATVEIEWPKRSGVLRRYPELDRADFFDFDNAWRKLIPAQRPLLERALASIGR